MKKVFVFILSILFCGVAVCAKAPIKVLIVAGQGDVPHNWEAGSLIIQRFLNESGLFAADIAFSPQKGEDMSAFRPDFSAYKVVVLNYVGDPWSDATKAAFVDYVKKGGGVVVYHAGNNRFADWKEYNEIIGLGGWDNRDEKNGPYVYFKDGKEVRDNSPGKGGAHGRQHEFVITLRDKKHPITKGLPDSWMHAKDELYDRLRGPALNLTVLATAFSDKATGGTDRDEPVLMTIKWGKGRIFHTTLGHVGKDDLTHPSVESASFIVTFLRGTEWAATGKVTQKVPADFPETKMASMIESLLVGASPTAVYAIVLALTRSKEVIVTVSSDGNVKSEHRPEVDESEDNSSMINFGKFCNMITITDAIKNIDNTYQGKCYVLRKVSLAEGCVELSHKPCP